MASKIMLFQIDGAKATPLGLGGIYTNDRFLNDSRITPEFYISNMTRFIQELEVWM